MPRGEKLLTASDLAALCEVDLKTIHNWVDRGRIQHFRTPGRHLRFRAPDVVEFLRAWGYSVPRELARLGSKTMLVIGTKDTQALVTRVLGDTPSLRYARHPYDALIHAGSDPADVYVFDPRALGGEVEPTPLVEAIRRACPLASFVALADEPVNAPPYVQRISRSDPSALKSYATPEEAPRPESPAIAAPHRDVATTFEAPLQRAAGSGR